MQNSQDRWQNSVYRLPLEPIFFGQLSLFLYAVATALIAAASARWWTVLFVLLYVGGFGPMTGVELWQSRPSLPHFFVKPKRACTIDRLNMQWRVAGGGWRVAGP
ncbi:MAG: hypothetical protein R2911_00355 [Caldilineaceae bacterium]